MFNLGDKLKDAVSGFEGIAVAETNWLNGCTRIGLQSDTLHDGKPIDIQWFDEPQLMLVEPDKVAPGLRKTGGPIPIPKRSVDPVR